MKAIVVHGGAGPHADGRRVEKEATVAAAAQAGWAVLAAGGSAVDAVEVATRVLEDDPLFDAGYGSYLNQAGVVEVDAILMRGQDRRFGAVGAVPGVRAAITLARRVMEETPHAFLVGAGAASFAARSNLTVDPASLIAPEAKAIWLAGEDAPPGARFPAESAADSVNTGAAGDTVGAVALDGAGHVAAATSTGGTRRKWPGRVGDSPVVGAGAYAHDATGAVSCTGHGESILSVCLAFQAHLAMARESAAAAVLRALAAVEDVGPGLAGLVAVDRNGGIGWAFATAAMPVAWVAEGTSGSAFDEAWGLVTPA